MRPDIPPPRQTRHHVIAAPAVPVDPPRPFGDLGTATPAELIELMLSLWPYSVATSWRQRRGMLDVLGHLAQAQGNTWQERWVASGLNENG